MANTTDHDSVLSFGPDALDETAAIGLRALLQSWDDQAARWSEYTLAATDDDRQERAKEIAEMAAEFANSVRAMFRETP